MPKVSYAFLSYKSDRIWLLVNSLAECSWANLLGSCLSLWWMRMHIHHHEWSFPLQTSSWLNLAFITVWEEHKLSWSERSLYRHLKYQWRWQCMFLLCWRLAQSHTLLPLSGHHSPQRICTILCGISWPRQKLDPAVPKHLHRCYVIRHWHRHHGKQHCILQLRHSSLPSYGYWFG